MAGGLKIFSLSVGSRQNQQSHCKCMSAVELGVWRCITNVSAVGWGVGGWRCIISVWQQGSEGGGEWRWIISVCQQWRGGWMDHKCVSSGVGGGGVKVYHKCVTAGEWRGGGGECRWIISVCQQWSEGGGLKVDHKCVSSGVKGGGGGGVKVDHKCVSAVEWRGGGGGWRCIISMCQQWSEGCENESCMSAIGVGGGGGEGVS